MRSRDMGRSVSVRRWTDTAIECYLRGCNCAGCYYKAFFDTVKYSFEDSKKDRDLAKPKCQMKASVLELVRVLGKPDVVTQIIIED